MKTDHPRALAVAKLLTNPLEIDQGSARANLARAYLDLRALLHEASSHVFRQQFAGKHAQDKADAADLLPRIEQALGKRRADP